MLVMNVVVRVSGRLPNDKLSSAEVANSRKPTSDLLMTVSRPNTSALALVVDPSNAAITSVKTSVIKVPVDLVEKRSLTRSIVIAVVPF